MTHQNLILTEQAIARHTKRLQKEFKKINHEIKLSEAQNIISRILGMKDYHELKKTLHFNNNEEVIADKSEKNLEYYLEKNNFINLEYARENLHEFFSDGNIQMVLSFLDSPKLEIQEYIKKNGDTFFNAAANNNQDYLLKLLIDRKIIDLSQLTDKETEELFWNLLLNSSLQSLDSFNYIFYELKFPQKISEYVTGMIIYHLTVLENIFVNKKQVKEILDKFFNDERVKNQKDFHWNKLPITVIKTSPENIKTTHIEYDLSHCVLNSVCMKGNLDLVKYLVEEQGQIPLSDGSTVQRACMSGNLDLVKYLIEDIKAPFIYFKKNYHKKMGDRDLTYNLDFSTLASAIQSNNLNLVQYLINKKQFKISDYDFLALRVALIESSDLYDIFLNDPECIQYVKSHAQAIFDKVVSKIHYNGKINNKNNYIRLQNNQYQITKKLLEKYSIKIDTVDYSNNNQKVIQMLENYQQSV